MIDYFGQHREKGEKHTEGEKLLQIILLDTPTTFYKCMISIYSNSVIEKYPQHMPWVLEFSIFAPFGFLTNRETSANSTVRYVIYFGIFEGLWMD